MDNILALHGLIAGLKATDKQALTDIANTAEANESTIKTNIANALNSVSTDETLGLSSSSAWIDIQNSIPNIKTGKKWGSGTIMSNASSQIVISGLSFSPTIITAYKSSTDQALVIKFSGATLPVKNTNNTLGFASWTATSDGGTLGVPTANSSYTWIAFE